MAEDIKPMIVEDATARLQQIIDETEKQFDHQVKITPGEAKRIELIRKMKEDTDKKEYMIMLNILIGVIVVLGILHAIMFKSLLGIGCLILSIVYLGMTRKRLKDMTNHLLTYKNDFDKYLWEGFYLKESRYSAVKLGYIVFFPLVCVLLTDLLSDNGSYISLWLSLSLAALFSTIAWLIYFQDDKNILEGLESDLKSLEYL